MSKIDNALLELGITPDLKGFRCIRLAIEEISKENNLSVCGLYQLIAEKTGSTQSRVERDIRYAFNRLDLSSEEYNKYIGIKSKTNSARLYTLAYKLAEV